MNIPRTLQLDIKFDNNCYSFADIYVDYLKFTDVFNSF